MSNRNIAAELGISIRTVKGHLINIFSKLGVSSRTEAVLQAIDHGWVISKSFREEVHRWEAHVNAVKSLQESEPEEPLGLYMLPKGPT